MNRPLDRFCVRPYSKLGSEFQVLIYTTGHYRWIIDCLDRFGQNDRYCSLYDNSSVHKHGQTTRSPINTSYLHNVVYLIRQIINMRVWQEVHMKYKKTTIKRPTIGKNHYIHTSYWCPCCPIRHVVSLPSKDHQLAVVKSVLRLLTSAFNAVACSHYSLAFKISKPIGNLHVTKASWEKW